MMRCYHTSCSHSHLDCRHDFLTILTPSPLFYEAESVCRDDVHKIPSQKIHEIGSLGTITISHIDPPHKTRYINELRL